MRFFFLFLVVLFPCAAWAQAHLTLYTEELPPYNYTEKGVLKGTNTEKLLTIFQHAGISLSRKDIIVAPWARAYTAARDTPNTCVYSTTRTAARENLFAWVGPLSSSSAVLFAKTGRNIVLDTIRQARFYRIAAVREDIGQLLLTQAGIPVSELVPQLEPILHKLEEEEIDLIAYGESALLNVAQQAGFASTAFKKVYTLEKRVLSLACNRDTDPDTIKKLQQALDAVNQQQSD